MGEGSLHAQSHVVALLIPSMCNAKGCADSHSPGHPIWGSSLVMETPKTFTCPKHLQTYNIA